MDFPNVPCFLLEFEHSTEVNNLGPSEIQRQLEFRHIDPTGKEIEKSSKKEVPMPTVDKNNATETVPKIKEFYDKKLSCNVRGNVELSKVKGTFNI